MDLNNVWNELVSRLSREIAQHLRNENGPLSPTECAAEIGCKVKHVYKLIATGRLRATNISDSDSQPRWVIRREDLEEFLDAN